MSKSTVKKIALVLLILICIVPPWERTFQKSTSPAGYALIFSPPTSNLSHIGYSLDWGRLAIQLLALGVGFSLAMKFASRP